MENKYSIVNRLKWQSSPEDRSMTLFYTLEEIRENLKCIEANLDTDNETDFHRMAQLEIISEQLIRMADRLDARKNRVALSE
jgi:hypothetical protein